MRSEEYTVLQAATTITAAEGSVGIINVTNYDKITLWFDYVKGDETSLAITPKYLGAAGGDEHEHMLWSTDNNQLKVAKDFKLSASGKAYIVLDVSAVAQVKVYQQATGGTPTGTLKVSYSRTRLSG